MANVKAEVVDFVPEEDKDIGNGDGSPNRAAAPRLKFAITGSGSSNFSGWTDKSKPSSISATMANVKAEVVDFEPEEGKGIGDGSPQPSRCPSAPKKTKGRDEAAAEADRFAAIRSLSAIDDAAIPSFVNYYASSDVMRGILSDIFYFACRNKNFSGWTDSLRVEEKKRPIDDIVGSSGNGGADARRIRQRSVHIRADAEVSADDIQPATLDSAGAP